MNAETLSLARRNLVQQGYGAPPRDELEIFREALEEHERSYPAFHKASNNPGTPALDFGIAQARYENTKSALCHAVEELTCVSATRLQRALAA